MSIYIVFLILITVNASKNPGKFCDVPSSDITKQCYLKETLLTIAHSPNQLAVDRHTNSLYFSFDSGQRDYTPVVFKINSKKLSVLKGVKDAFAITSDSERGEIYFGGSHGLYKYNPLQRKLKRLAINNLDIWWTILKKKAIYFIKFPKLNAYYYENRTVKPVYELQNNPVHQFVFDLHDNIFFTNNSGLFGIKNGTSTSILLREYPKFHNMATDNNGNVYLCSDDGIYVITKIVQKVKRLVSLQGVLGLTFDKNNNLIYSDSHELVRLVPMSQENYYHNIATRKP